MRIALCLQTCDRADYTARTLASWASQNDLGRFLCLHGDDASSTSENVSLAARYGFSTVVSSTIRRGMTATRQALVAAAVYAVDWVFLLENDIDCVRPFPWSLFNYAAAQARVESLRLYGRFKDAAGTDACLKTRKHFGPELVTWRPFKGAPEASQIGLIHWSAQPSVTRAAVLHRLLRKDADLKGLTVRVKTNVSSHFGVARTEGRVK